ncbi:XAP5-domain-containing protein [Ascobolus immersus RN42]|uniref:XAP5-domain-containing protein n=1 Tax=Ascobolus immersus RN42 TaxID=1160509 RepID=A0A3N4IGV9_ASCIM|nr:XAP5-domain-containing protein [Ascobolus immersus RN42]
MSNTPTPSGSGTTTPSRFASQTATIDDVLSTQTVGLVNLAEFKKRRAELLEQKEREVARRGGLIGAATSSGEAGGKPQKKKRKVKQQGGLSFAGDDEDEDTSFSNPKTKTQKRASGKDKTGTEGGATKEPLPGTTGDNASVGTDHGQTVTPTGNEAETDVTSKAPIQENTSSASPPVSTPSDPNSAAIRPEGSDELEAGSGQEGSGSTGIVIKKKPNPRLAHPPPKALTKSTLMREAAEREALRREFLAMQEKVKNEEIIIPFIFYDGTNVFPKEEGVKVKKGEAVWLFLERARRMSGRREWLRVSVDDLLLVRGELIIPHHYEFYYFIVNQTEGPNGLIFDYSKEPSEDPKPQKGTEDPTLTKVVDRRWYERNKHIFPASIWTEFDPNITYKGRIRRDKEDNSFFFS